MSNAPFETTSTPAMDRANRLMSLKDNPGFLDLLRISQELVEESVQICTDYGGWDAQQIVVLKIRMQAAKEHHQRLIAKMMEAIQVGIEEARSQVANLPAKTAEQAVEQGDFVRQKVLEKFEEVDNRPAGSY